MDDITELIRKRNALHTLGFTPPYTFFSTHEIDTLHETYESINAGERTDHSVTVHGIVQSHRIHGKLRFLDIVDLMGNQIQIHASAREMTPVTYEALNHVDRGDWIGVSGRMMRTKRGEMSIDLTELTILSKTLRSPPNAEEGFGVETRLRYPWRALRFDDVYRRRLIQRARMKASIRRTMDHHHFIEIDTPILCRNYGGASAKPFVTHCNAIDEDLFLQISPEPSLKEAVVGGIPRVYTISRNFRNEDVDTTHNPEFEILECYQVGADYFIMMDLAEKMIAQAAIDVTGSTHITYRGQSIDLTPPWRRVRIADLVSKGLAPVDAYEAFNERTLEQPTFVYDYPKEISPLTRSCRDGSLWVERFELFISGIEMANAYSELTDPEEQERRLVEQEQNRQAGVAESYPMDTDFVDAIYTGLPTCGGLGIGIDRLAMLLTDAPAIQNVLLAPLVRRKEEQT